MDTFAHIETPKRAYKGDRFEARSEDVPLGDIAFRYRNASDEIAARPLEGCGTVSLVPANSAAVSSAKPMPSHGSEPLPFRPLTKGALGRLDVAHGRYTLSVSLREDTKLAPCDALISGAPRIRRRRHVDRLAAGGCAGGGTTKAVTGAVGQAEIANRHWDRTGSRKPAPSRLRPRRQNQERDRGRDGLRE